MKKELMLTLIRLLTQTVNLLRRQVEVQKSELSRQAIYKEAIASLGKDVSPIYNEFGCAESVNTIVKSALGYPAGGGASTYRMYAALHDSTRFAKVSEPLEGDIVISPTGHGNGGLSNGHVGIIGEDRTIMSNNSGNSLWESNYTLDTWRARYVDLGGFPMEYYRAI